MVIIRASFPALDSVTDFELSDCHAILVLQEAYCVLLWTIKLGPSVIESKEAAGFDDM